MADAAICLFFIYNISDKKNQKYMNHPWKPNQAAQLAEQKQAVGNVK